MKKNGLLILLCLTCAINYSVAQIFYADGSPGKAIIRSLGEGETSLENNVIRIVFKNDGQNFL